MSYSQIYSVGFDSISDSNSKIDQTQIQDYKNPFT